jgi:hypothetical protein
MLTPSDWFRFSVWPTLPDFRRVWFSCPPNNAGCAGCSAKSERLLACRAQTAQDEERAIRAALAHEGACPNFKVGLRFLEIGSAPRKSRFQVASHSGRAGGRAGGNCAEGRRFDRQRVTSNIVVKLTSEISRTGCGLLACPAGPAGGRHGAVVIQIIFMCCWYAPSRLLDGSLLRGNRFGAATGQSQQGAGGDRLHDGLI